MIVAGIFLVVASRASATGYHNFLQVAENASRLRMPTQL
jgi:hypothetical protein